MDPKNGTKENMIFSNQKRGGVREVLWLLTHCCSGPAKSARLGCTLAYPPPAEPTRHLLTPTRLHPP